MSEKVDALRLTFYTAPSSCAVLAPFFYAREARPAPAGSRRSSRQPLPSWPRPSWCLPSCAFAVSHGSCVPQRPPALYPGRQGTGAEGAGRARRSPALGLRGGERRRGRGAEVGPRGAQAGAFVAYLPAHMQGVVGILLVSSCLALAYNVVHATMIQRLSAVTTTVLGEAKIVALLALSALFLGAPARPHPRRALAPGSARSPRRCIAAGAAAAPRRTRVRWLATRRALNQLAADETPPVRSACPAC